MSWLKRNLWKVGIAFAGMLLLWVCMVWLPVSAADTHEGAPGLAVPGIVTVQATPIEDATVTALNKEKLEQEIDQLKNQSFWAWTTIGPILVGFAGLLAALYSFITWIRNRQDEQKKQREDRKLEREKRAEERFQAAVTGLGDEKEGAKVSAAILLRTFLRPDYEQFYTQTFDLAVANLRLPRTAHPPEDPTAPLPLTTLSQALIVVFKEAFPLARENSSSDHEEKGALQSLDATGVQLDSAYLAHADLKQAWMPQASLRGANLFDADLSVANLSEALLRGANLSEADLSGTELSNADLSGAILPRTRFIKATLIGVDLNEAFLKGANLSGALLTGATLIKAELSEANLSGARLSVALLNGAKLLQADLSDAKLNGAQLNGADLSEANLSGTDLKGANLQQAHLSRVKGLTKEQLAVYKASGAIIDEDPMTSSSQTTVSPSPSSQSHDAQVQSGTPTPGIGGSNSSCSKLGQES